MPVIQDHFSSDFNIPTLFLLWHTPTPPLSGVMLYSWKTRQCVSLCGTEWSHIRLASGLKDYSSGTSRFSRVVVPLLLFLSLLSFKDQVEWSEHCCSEHSPDRECAVQNLRSISVVEINQQSFGSKHRKCEWQTKAYLEEQLCAPYIVAPR